SGTSIFRSAASRCRTSTRYPIRQRNDSHEKADIRARGAAARTACGRPSLLRDLRHADRNRVRRRRRRGQVSQSAHVDDAAGDEGWSGAHHRFRRGRTGEHARAYGIRSEGPRAREQNNRDRLASPGQSGRVLPEGGDPGGRHALRYAETGPTALIAIDAPEASTRRSVTTKRTTGGEEMNRTRVGIALALFSAACLGQDSGSRPSTVTDEMLRAPDPADWLMWRRTLDGWGYSPLDQIDRENVARLEQVWTQPMGDGTQEATPLVHDGVMFVPNNADYIQAFDAATGEIRWEYRREYPEGLRGGTNRNLAIWGRTVINASSDNRIYALDVDTGELVWETPVHDAFARARATSGPIVADGKVITGRQCQP